MAVVFRVAAGPRLGFGHLVRCRALARALGVRPRMSIRGTAATRAAARRLGVEIAPGLGALATARPAVVVVDDPHGGAAQQWITSARRHGVPVVALADHSQDRPGADLVVDGRADAPAGCAGGSRALHGPRYAIVDARIAGLRRRDRRTVLPAVDGPSRRRGPRVVVALGGGRHVRQYVAPLVAALAAALPGADIRVAPGFTTGPRPRLLAGQWLEPQALVRSLATATLAVVAGGVTAYEALALGVPAVGVAVVAAQRPALQCLAALGALVDGGRVQHDDTPRRLAHLAASLAASPRTRRRLSARGRRLVDGRGTFRIAAAIAHLGREASRG